MKFNIAIIEDNPITVELLLEMFSENKDYNVFVFYSPAEFFLRHREFDLVISDWNFGHVNLGFFLKEMNLKKLIVLTGSMIVLNVDCVAVLHKVTDHERLLDIVGSFLTQTRSSSSSEL